MCQALSSPRDQIHLSGCVGLKKNEHIAGIGANESHGGQRESDHFMQASAAFISLAIKDHQNKAD